MAKWDLMQQWRDDRMVGIWIVLLSMLPGGCHKSFPPVTIRADGTLPADQTIASEPLILHCDFTLPQRQRLVDQLVQQRSMLREKLNLAFSEESVHVYLFASDQAYYGFLGRQFPDFPPRRALFVETDSQLAVYAHWGDHVVEDLRHEVTHGYLHSVVPRLPLWLDEGLAEYFEVGREHQGFHGSHVALLHQQLRTGAWQPDLVQLESLESAGKMTQQNYAESWAWVHFLLETRGQRRELLAQYLADLQESQTVEPLSRCLDKQLARAGLTLIEHLESLQQARSEQRFHPLSGLQPRAGPGEGVRSKFSACSQLARKSGWPKIEPEPTLLRSTSFVFCSPLSVHACPSLRNTSP